MGSAFLPATPELSIRARILAEGGPQLWEDFMDELRTVHLGGEANPGQESVLQRLEQAYQDALERG